MHIIFDNNNRVEIELNDSPVKVILEKQFKHLEKIPLPFRPWDLPLVETDTDSKVINLISAAKKLNIQIDTYKLKQNTQNYLNSLHEVYEKNYNGDPAWLDYHEQIHLLEKTDASPDLVLYHREIAGPLKLPVDLSWLSASTSQIKAGDVYVAWAELGKIPYQYWKDKELNDLQRLCDLAKPWINFYPKLCVSLIERDFLNMTDAHEFNAWWRQYASSWCAHWQISSWTLKDMYSVLVVGTVDLEKLNTILKQNARPVYVQLN